MLNTLWLHGYTELLQQQISGTVNNRNRGSHHKSLYGVPVVCPRLLDMEDRKTPGSDRGHRISHAYRASSQEHGTHIRVGLRLFFKDLSSKKIMDLNLHI
jgi:hypothetical protein